jgi:hypothetical protein
MVSPVKYSWIMPSERKTVEIPRGVFALMIGALVAAVLVIAFLFGRASVRAPAPASTAPAPSVQSPSHGVENTWPEAISAPSVPSPSPGGSNAWPPAPSAPAVSANTLTDAALGEAVARYFGEMEAIERQAKGRNDPQELAQRILSQATADDSSGFDELIRTSESLQRQISALIPPPPCQEHHQKTLAVIGESSAMLRRLRDAVLNRDMSALALFGSEGQVLEQRTREVDALAASIKRRYGLGG